MALVWWLASAALLPSASACGNYCGAFLCGGELQLGGRTCDRSVAPVDWNSDASCVDACCRDHDGCCDAADGRGECNRRMVECLDACDDHAASCWYGFLPLSKRVYQEVMRAVEDWCCNMPCS